MQEVEEKLEELGVLGEGRGHSRSEGLDGQTQSGCFMFTQIYTNIGIITSIFRAVLKGGEGHLAHPLLYIPQICPPPLGKTFAYSPDIMVCCIWIT